MKKKALITITMIILFFITGALYFFVYEDSLRGTMYNSPYADMIGTDEYLTYEQTKEDIDYLYNLIKTRHYSALGRTVPTNVKTAYESVIEDLDETNSMAKIWRSIATILHELNDGHARTGYIFPDVPYVYDTAFDIRARAEWYIDIDGSKYQLISIHGLPVEEVYDIAKATFSYENVYYLHYLLEARLIYAIYELYFTDNLTQNGSIQYLDSSQNLIDGQMNLVLYESNAVEPVRFSIDIENKVGLLEINQMINDQDSKDTFHEFFLQVKLESIETVIIDLQQNGGGNSLIIQDLMTYFPLETYTNYGSSIRYRLFHLVYDPREVKNEINQDLVFSGQTYLITSSRTFSSAAMFSAIFKDNEMGLIVGEPMGNQPSMYGDVLQYQLPNSGFPVTLTYKFFTRPNGVLSDDTIYPDLIVNPEDAYQEILDYIENNSNN